MNTANEWQLVQRCSQYRYDETEQLKVMVDYVKGIKNSHSELMAVFDQLIAMLKKETI